MLVKDMTRFIPSKHKSISTILYKIKAIDLVARDDDGMWSLRPRVTPDILIGEEVTHPVNETPKDSILTPYVASEEASEPGCG